MKENIPRIANVIHHLTRGGGVVVQALNIAKAIQKLNFQVSFATMTTQIQDPTSIGISEGIPIRFTPSHFSGVLSPFLLCRTLAKMIDELGCTIIQAFDPIVAGLAAVFVKQFTKHIPLVIRLGTTYPDFFYSKYIRPETSSIYSYLKSYAKIRTMIPAIAIVERLTLDYADIVVPNCRYLASIYSNRIQQRGKIKVIHNGVDTKRFSPEGYVHPLSKDNIWILYVGRIEDRKGLDVLIQAMSEIVPKHPKTRLLIVGRAPNPRSLSSLMNLVRKFGIQSNVIFKGPVSSNVIPSLMRACDVLVFPSTTQRIQVEGLPNTILEGMSTEIPIVSTNICGVPEVISHMKTGLLVEPSSVEQLAAAIITLIESQTLRKELGSNARYYILRNNTIMKAAKQYLALYQHILNKNNS